MNDLVSLLFYIERDEEDTFWCFKGLMDRIVRYFNFYFIFSKKKSNQGGETGE